MIEIDLNKANRLKVARAFRHNKRVDISIECVIEGQMGRVYVDDPGRLAAYCLAVGPFRYFAGDAGAPGGRRLMEALAPYNILMPSPALWPELAREVFGDHLRSFSRYSFSTDRLSSEHLNLLLEHSPHRDSVVRLDLDLIGKIAGQPNMYLDLEDFESAADFMARGMGYTLLEEGQAMGIAYSSLVNSRGIEVSVYVKDAYRRQGVAAALCSRLLLECLQHGLRPNWDAANPESVRLAEKLGYTYLESYDAYCHTRKPLA
jgi:GNAT superfamily N-acetyltransferase